MTDEHDRITAETLPLTDEQLLDQQIVIALDILQDTKFKLASLAHVAREVERDMESMFQRLKTMQEARKKP